MKEPRGTRDFDPDQMGHRRRVEATLRDVFERFGYREVQTPTFERLELFTAKSGPGIVDELYDFEDKGGRHMALRPEVTAPVMRFYFNRMKMDPKPVKLYYVANCFRYDRPQAGRFREFWQMGCELIGEDAPVALADLVALGVRLLEAAGLDDYRLRIGHLGILRAALDAAGVAADGRPEIMRLVDKRDVDGVKGRLGGAAAPILELFAAQTVEQVEAAAADDAARQAVGRLRDVLGHLEHLGVPADRVAPDPAIARGLDYYTDLVFEIDAPRLGAEKQLLGGGTYDLADVFGENPVPTAGFALGFDRLLVALEAEGRAPGARRRIDVHAAALDPDATPVVLRLADGLRRAGAHVELDAEPKAPGKALKRATQVGARYALLVGRKELDAGTVAFKDLDAGRQEDLAADALVDHWRAATGQDAETPTTPRSG